MSRDDKGANFAIGVLLGVIGGAIVGLIFAPKKGEETVKDIKNAVSSAKEKIEPELEKTKSKAREFLEQAKCKLEAQYNKIKENYKARKLADAKNKEHDIYCL